MAPVRNLRFTQSYLEALAGTVAVASERKTLKGFLGGVVVPAVRIDGWTFTGAHGALTGPTARRVRSRIAVPDLDPLPGGPMPAFDVDALRREFPALAREQDGRPVAYLDGPGGTQVPQRVIDAVAELLPGIECQRRRRLRDERAADEMVDEAHAAVADFLGAGSPDEIKFGYNMSTLTLAIGRSIGATLDPGDEIVVTTLDHEANVSTWKAMAADRGVTVRTVDIHEDDVTLDLEDLESKLGPRTKLVASARPAMRSGRSTRSARSSPAPTRSGR